MFIVLRGKYIDLKTKHIECILKFLEINRDCCGSENCLVCDSQLSKIYSKKSSNCFDLFRYLEFIEDSIENKVCDICIIKIHSKPPKFIFSSNLNRNSQENFEIIQNSIILRYLIGYYDSMILKNENKENVCQLKDLKKYMKKIDEDESFEICNQNKFMNTFIKSYRNFVLRKKSNKIIEKQIQYKIQTVEEQLTIINENHRKAIIEGDLEATKNFKEIYCNLFELKLRLTEKLYTFSKGYQDF